MRKFIVVAVLFFGLYTLDFCVFSQSQDSVYIDLLEVFSKYKKTEDYDKVLESKQSKKEEGLEEKKKEIDKLQEELKLLKESEKEKKKEEIEAKVGDFDSLRRQAFLDLRRERDDKMKEILQDIDEAVEKYAKKNRLKMILKKAAVAYGDKSLDRTKAIIDILNKGYKR